MPGKIIFITGFTRGGTSWLRNCVAFHPLVMSIPHEIPLFRDCNDRRAIETVLERGIRDNNLPASPWYVNKAPANAPYIDKACRLLPEAKFIFIIRDPRDVLVSHQRGNQAWMRGSNSTVQGCMNKIQRYYEGYIRARHRPNLLLVRYEDLHQCFHRTMGGVYEFIGLPYDLDLLNACFEKNNFVAVTGRRHKENRDLPDRKGVIGDWANFLTPDEMEWYEQNEFWREFITANNYNSPPFTFGRMCAAISRGGVRVLSEQDLIETRIDDERANIFLLHDIDSLDSSQFRKSVLETARMEGEYGLAGIFNFLPLDDPRYHALSPEEIIAVIRRVKELSPLASIGLHFNAAERFFSAGEPDCGNNHPDIPKALACLHRQVDAYAGHGIEFRFATAHGYGRAKKRPNNRDTPVFARELKGRGIELFEAGLRDRLFAKAVNVISVSDVGGALNVWDMPINGGLDHSETYRNLPRGTLMHILTHPGNYDVRRYLPLGFRQNTTL